MGYLGWPAGLGFRLRAFAAVLNPGLGNGRTLRSPTGEIGLSEIQIVFVKVSICPETMRSHPESLRETNFEATVASFEFSWKFGRKSKPNRKWSGRDPWLCSKWGKGPSWHPPAGVRPSQAEKWTSVRAPVQRFCNVRFSKRLCYRIDLSRKGEK